MTSTTSQWSSPVSSEEGTSHTGKVDERQTCLIVADPLDAKHILAKSRIFTVLVMLEVTKTLGLIRLPRKKENVSHPGKSPRSSISCQVKDSHQRRFCRNLYLKV